MKIAILMRDGEPYNNVNPGSPWLPHKKTVSPETAIFRYMKHVYPNVQIDTYNIKTIHKLDPKNYRKVYVLFVDIVMTFIKYKHKKQLYDKFIEKLQKIPNLVPNIEFIKFITDKCKYYKYLYKNDYPVLKTKCKKLSESSNRLCKRPLFQTSTGLSQKIRW